MFIFKQGRCTHRGGAGAGGGAARCHHRGEGGHHGGQGETQA